jgi:outer membrane protein OmpA-like peptidoglycan-associated protein
MKHPSRMLILTLSAAAIAGCTNLDGSASRAGTGGLVGAGTGALLGGLVSDGDSGATIAGGVIGALAGTAIGSQLDRQAAELQQSIGGSGAGIVNTGSELIVSLPESITFAVDSADVRADYRDELASVAGNLQSYPNSSVQVIGHTDDTGSAAYNQGLSERRAVAVADLLTADGVPAWRLQSSGRGLSQPVASNATPEGRAANRRVEIVITPQA